MKFACVVATILISSAIYAENKDLARVSILNYVDETGTTNYGYLPSAFSEAIDQSLQTRFEYVREEPAKSEKERLKIRADGVFDAKDAAEFCKRYHTDILIFGRYTFEPKTKQLVVKTYISLGTVDKFRELPERRNPTDATIFKVADKVADDIVREMTTIAKEQKGGKKTSGKKDEKLELKKSPAVTWTDRKWMVGGGLQGFVPVGDFAQVAQKNALISVHASRILYRSFYLGLNAQAGEAKSFNNNTPQQVTMKLWHAQAAIGYAFFFWRERFRLNAEIGGGAYRADLTIIDNSAGATLEFLNAKYWNPALRGAASLHFLIFSFLSAGIEVSYAHLFDKGNKPLQHAGVGLSLNFIF